MSDNSLPEHDMHQKVLQLIARVSGRDVASLTPQANLTVDLELDSPKALELLMELEDELGMEISDDQAAGLETVQDILTLCEQQSS